MLATVLATAAALVMTPTQIISQTRSLVKENVARPELIEYRDVTIRNTPSGPVVCGLANRTIPHLGSTGWTQVMVDVNSRLVLFSFKHRGYTYDDMPTKQYVKRVCSHSTPINAVDYSKALGSR